MPTDYRFLRGRHVGVPLEQLGGGLEALRRAGFQVIEAADADAAMEFINSAERIDLVFTDVWTPGVLNDLALAKRVQAKFPMMPLRV